MAPIGAFRHQVQVVVVLWRVGAAILVGLVGRGLARVGDDVAVGIDRKPAPARVRSVVIRVELAVLGEQNVVGIAIAGRVDLHGAVRRDLGHVEAVIAAPWAGNVEPVRILFSGHPVIRAVRIVQRRKVVDVRVGAVLLHAHGVNGSEIHAQDRGGVGVLDLPGEVVRWSARVGVSALRDVERLPISGQLEAVGRVVLLGTRQAAHDVDLLPITVAIEG